MHTQRAKQIEKERGMPRYHSIIVTSFGKLNDGRKFWNIKNSWGKNWGMVALTRYDSDAIRMNDEN
jgi:hypothetical protein